MKLPFREQGVALVIVLAFIVLLTGLVMAFFSQALSNRQLSDSSFNQTKVDELARSGLDIIIGDLKQEISNGTNTPSPQRNVPATSGLNTLLRTSQTAPIQFPAVDHPASPAPATERSRNGRSLSSAFWNRHYLLPRMAGAAPMVTDPDSAFNAVAPNWVFVTTQGPVALTAPPAANAPKVIGRYAYAIYDQGALLDANVAGYPSTLANHIPNPLPPAPSRLRNIGYAAKGASAFADLTQLLPLHLTPDEKTAQIDNLVGWRNFATLQADGHLKEFVIPPNGPELFFDSIWANNSGFTKVNGTQWKERTDQAFLSRRQLIDFTLSSGGSPEMLQYLSTFSRGLSAPTWGPSINSDEDPNFKGDDPAVLPAIQPVLYKDRADDPLSYNRNIAKVTFPETIAVPTVRHYNDDGTYEDVPVAAGDPVVQRRFSLAKLAWLGTDGPDPAAFSSSLTAAQRDAAIAACFGLAWNQNTNTAPGQASNARWNYTKLVNTTPIAIKTLAQVAAENREPNFFELLAAGILDGSLGRDPGTSATGFGDVSGDIPTGPAGTLFYTNNAGTEGGYSFNKAHHILRIGANIIDQYDSDSYPTAIFAPYPGNPGLPSEELASTMFGIENLPYIHRLSHVGFCDPRNSTVGASSPYPITGFWHFWWKPELWNPHQAPATTDPLLNPRPTQFRARVYGRAFGRLSGLYVGTGPIIDFDTNPVYTEAGATRNDGGGSFNDGKTFRDLYFTDSGGVSSPFYTRPKMIYNDPAGSNIVDTANTAAINLHDPTVNPPAQQRLQAAEGANARTAGIFFGSRPYSRPTRTSGGFINSGVRGEQLNQWGYTMALEWKDSSGGWRPYTTMGRLKVVLESNISGNSGSRFDGMNNPGSRSFLHVPDPRTDRFSASATENSGQVEFERTMVTGASPAGVIGRVMKYFPKPSSATTGRGFVVSGTNGKHLHYLMMNKPGLGGANTVYYADRDGVVRPGDAIHTAGTTGNSLSGDGLFLYHSDDAASTASAVRRRPVMLDRPFRTVGELGYAFRDLPGKNLDFWSRSSADAALLDLFSVQDEPAMVAGQINPTNAPAPVVRAVIAGAMKNQAPVSTLSDTETTTLANHLVTAFQASPISNRAALPSAINAAVEATVATLSNKTDPLNELRNKGIAEAPLRAFSSITDTRTWNLMIDLVAQVGHFPPGAPETQAALNQSFVVTGERRYWLHVAIDRFSGRIIAQELEPVYE